jgi:hypothetical protein
MRVVAVVVLITNVNLFALSTWYIATHEHNNLAMNCNGTALPLINMTEAWDAEEDDAPKGGVPMEYDVQGPFLFRNEQLNQTATAFVPGERVWAIMLLRDAAPDTKLRLLEAWACSPGNNGGMPLPYSHTNPLQTGCYTPSLNIEEDVDSGFQNGHRWKVWHAQAAPTPRMRTEFASKIVSDSHPSFAKMKGMSGAGLSFLVDPLVSSGSHVSQAAPIFLVITWTIELRLTQIASFDVAARNDLLVAKNHSYVTFYKVNSGLVPLSILTKQ